MRIVRVLALLIVLRSLAAPQVMPASNGGCGVSTSGAISCNWLSSLPPKGKGTGVQLFVTRYNLAPQAPVDRPVSDFDEVIVSMKGGVLVN